MALSTRRCPNGKEFIFRTPAGNEVARAGSVAELAAQISRAPIESIAFHANNGHFIPWLEMMGERMLAAQVKIVRGQGEAVRKTLLAVLR